MTPRQRQRLIAIGVAIAVDLFVAAFVLADLYLWPQLRLPVAYLGAASFGLLILLGLGAIIFHAVNGTDRQMEAKGKADRRLWRDALARSQADKQ